MIRTRNFVWVNGSEKKDEPGWRPEDAPHFDPGGPLITAHDTMEHLSNRTDWESELMASGVAMFTRGLSEAETMYGVTARDIFNFWGRDQAFVVKKAPQHWKNWKWPTELTKAYWSEVKTEIMAMHERAQEMIRLGMFPEEEAKKIVSQKVLMENLVEVEGWVKLGFRLAMRVYRANTPDEINQRTNQTADLFVRIMDAVSNDHNEDLPEVGSKLAITLDTNNLTYTLERTNPENHKAEVFRDEHLKLLRALRNAFQIAPI